jgi:hypothetical protein
MTSNAGAGSRILGSLPCLSRPGDRRRLVTLIGWSSPTSGRSMMGIRDRAGRGPDITAEAR